MKRFYLSESNYLDYSQEKFEKLENINLLDGENKKIKKGKRMNVCRYDEKVFVVIAPVDMFVDVEEGEE